MIIAVVAFFLATGKYWHALIQVGPLLIALVIWLAFTLRSQLTRRASSADVSADSANGLPLADDPFRRVQYVQDDNGLWQEREVETETSER